MTEREIFALVIFLVGWAFIVTIIYADYRRRKRDISELIADIKTRPVKTGPGEAKEMTKCPGCGLIFGELIVTEYSLFPPGTRIENPEDGDEAGLLRPGV